MKGEEGGHAVEGRTTVYIRADNVSDPIKKATVEEMEWFERGREKSRREKNRVWENAQRHAQYFLERLRERHRLGETQPKGRFVFWIVPTFPRAPIATPKQLYAMTQHPPGSDASQCGQRVPPPDHPGLLLKEFTGEMK